ncbi:MAG: DUF2784 domain-containing protein [Deltaproteobacteria bacterium]|nr:DUF2784 domain-containing protein [Deltaproteobacteria bacterium]
MNRLLADGVLCAHLALVLFITLGLPAIPLGGLRGWRWVRSFRFRAAHLAAISVVAAEALAGIACPLTVWEDALRGRGGGDSFVARLLHRVLFYDLPEWVFTTSYAMLAVAALALWRAVPPRTSRSSSGGGEGGAAS